MITILVAYDSNRAIGKGGKIPWHLPEDLKAFKRRTTGHAIIMGRKTWESLPKKPLPNRTNIILTKQKDYDVGVEVGDPVFCVEDPQIALDLAEEATQGKEIFIVGGESVYTTYLKMGVVDRVLATKVLGLYEGDTYFPNLADVDGVGPYKGEWKWNIIDQQVDYSVWEFTKDGRSYETGAHPYVPSPEEVERMNKWQETTRKNLQEKLHGS